MVPQWATGAAAASFNRTGGVQHMFAALDLATGQMFYRFCNHKRWTRVPRVPQAIAGAVPGRKVLCLRTSVTVPGGKLYVVCDNFGPHKKAEVLDRCRTNGVELVFHPEQRASWLNWIECGFTALRYFPLDGSDYPSHTAQQHAIAGYLRWKNKRTQRKTRFAIDSKIRRPDDLPNVA